MFTNQSFNKHTPLRLAVTAAHGGSSSERVPLGGGAAICERLCRCWAGDPRVEVTLLAPGTSAPEGINYKRIDVLGGKSPASLNELAYAKFCRAFEKQLTDELLAMRPDAVLTHDLAEAPNFAMLERYGIPCIPIYHVDVVDFFCRMYLHRLITPRQAESLWRYMRPYPIVPDILRLVFDKQAESVQFCPKLIVPSETMRSVLQNTYPQMQAQQAEVIPWGSPILTYSEAEINAAVAQLEQRYELNANSQTIVTLSRISPEKGQDLLLQGLLDNEKSAQFPENCTVFICGQSAYMGGERFFARLQALAKRLKRIRVIFPGHLGGVEKAAMLRRADVFVSASRHESYGLTTMEAMLQHTAIVAVDSAGTRQTVTPECAITVPRDALVPANLYAAVSALLSQPERRQQMAEYAQKRASQITFRDAAESILSLLQFAAEHKR
ncbi:glycosyltransferase family 4 protein [bacterium]|nr:glycosyltransferase family 4 protein [bacterium]